MQLQGMRPQTGEQINRWDCVDNLTPMLLIENTQQARRIAASLDGVRNETAKAASANAAALACVVAAYEDLRGGIELSPPATKLLT